MKTVLDTIHGGTEYLEKRGVEDARLTMQILLARVLGCERIELYLDFDRPLDEEHLGPLRESVMRRGRGEPLQHIVGDVEFYGREFKSDARALIPRPETEELAGMVLKRRGKPGEGEVWRVLDMGCGSGVLGLTLAAEWGAGAAAVLVDASEEALGLARENGAALELGGVEFVHGDLFSGLGGREFDVVVANLPYVPSREIPGLSREVQRDPLAALDGGEDGLEVVRRFCGDVRGYVADGGMVALEIGEGQSEAVAGMLVAGGFTGVESARDLSGVERYVFGT